MPSVCPPSGAVVAVSTSPAKGMRKRPVPSVLLVTDHGIAGDAHAGKGSRQVSLLALESIEKMRAKGCDVVPGDFAENVTTEGVPVASLAVGDRLRIGEGALLEITQIGKECHERCAIYYQAGDCVMPREGVFARVVRGGEIRPGDEVEKIASSHKGVGQHVAGNTLLHAPPPRDFGAPFFGEAEKCHSKIPSRRRNR